MRSIFLCDSADSIKYVYPQESIQKLTEMAGMNKIIYTKKDILAVPSNFDQVEYIFSTWGMPRMSEEEIRNVFPNVKCLFYAAGSVQNFARPFLNCGIKVFSAWAANAVPVAEYTVAQILLANTGYFHTSTLMSKGSVDHACSLIKKLPGNYDVTVGIIGVGMIGRRVIELLKNYNINVMAYSPSLTKENAATLGVKSSTIEEIFANCQVVSNHLANLQPTAGIFKKKHFASMRPYATFINTGRGAQVVEPDLVEVLTQRPDLFAVLDVTDPEPPEIGHPFYELPNCILTPHIAGSIGNEVHRMSLYMIEFSLEGYVNVSEYDSWVRAFYYQEDNMIFANNNSEERPHPWYHGYCATDISAKAFDTSKNAFLGTYGSIEMPEAIEKGGLTNSLAACERMVGVLENEIDLEAGESKSFHFVVGLTDSLESARGVVRKVLAHNYFAENLEVINNRKENLAAQMIFESPDDRINSLANFWLKQQVQLCVEVGRGAGKGFRDQLQDSWAIASFDGNTARNKIYETLQNIYHTGRCVRGWLPLKDRNMCDGPGWVGSTISAYLKETGDFGFLNEKVKYIDEGEDTVWDHLITTMRYSSNDIGEHGLVLAHEGDWNDSLNGMGRSGKGESVWASIALYQALNETASIAEKIVYDKGIESEMRERAARIKDAVEESGWDGEWYLAGYSDKGKKVGSHEEQEGMIYLNPQTWAAITGIASGERLEKCIASTDKYLDSNYGPLTLYPSYTSYNPEIGRLTGFVPGIWENGTPYCHGSAFKIISDCVLGRGDEAYESLLKITPDSDYNPTTHSGCEPYAYTNMYFGPDNPRKGETAFGWITGTAGWVYRCMSQYMLGFHPEFDGFTMDPCIPSKWKTLNGLRKFRKDIYRIEIENPNGKSKGIQSLTVDGRGYSRNYVPLFNDGKEHTIKVIL